MIDPASCAHPDGCYAPESCAVGRRLRSVYCAFANRKDFAEAYPDTAASRAFYVLYPELEDRHAEHQAA